MLFVRFDVTWGIICLSIYPHMYRIRQANPLSPGTRGTNWYGEKRTSFIRSKVRTQNAWLLHLAGDFHGAFETKQVLHRPHHMRVMLTSNLAVDQRFANGTRLVVRVLLFVWVGRGDKNQTRHRDRGRHGESESELVCS